VGGTQRPWKEPQRSARKEKKKKKTEECFVLIMTVFTMVG
jgi:hypothetical protein